MGCPFLTARWHNVFLVTYAVPPGLLEERLPPGLTLDLRDGNAFVSLVAFRFLNTRVWGIAWPGYRDFAELNLRFYVRDGNERGVAFIREFVPQRLVAWTARLFYNEPYLAAPISAEVEELPAEVCVSYRLRFAGRDHHIRVRANKPAVRPGVDSLEHFFKEHKWGFGVTRTGQCMRYAVSHPVWDVYPIADYRLDFDFGAVYGEEWRFLGETTPYSTVLAVGSDIAVYGKTEHAVKSPEAPY